MTKLDEAIKQVGEQNGFTYIIDNTAGIIAYKSSAAIDVSSMVRKVLGI